MKSILLLLICFGVLQAKAQTEKELIGKWKLVKLSKNGEEKSIQETYKTDQVYQVFEEDHGFVGIVGEKTGKGKWSLTDNNQTLEVKIGITKVRFKVDHFDEKKRIISSDKTGTLEYTKVN